MKMNNEIIISHISMPYGVLHDQKLNSVKCENNQMIFTFDIKIFPQNYVGDCYKQYECYKHCDMIVAMKEESFNNFNFVSATDKSGKFEGISLSQAEFINAINNAYTAEFIDCFANNSELKIELSINYYDAEKQYRKYRKFSLCSVALYAEKVIWNWY